MAGDGDDSFSREVPMASPMNADGDRVTSGDGDRVTSGTATGRWAGSGSWMPSG